MSGALGYGRAHLVCDTCSSNAHLDGLDGLLAVGGTPTPHLRVGVVLEIMQSGVGHYAVGADTTAFLMNVTVSFDYYPGKRNGFFTEAAVGLSDYRVVKNPRDGLFIPNGDATPAAGTGLGASVGVGYQFPIGKDVSLAPRLTDAFGLPHNLHAPNGVTIARGWRQNMLAFTVVFGVHASP